MLRRVVVTGIGILSSLGRGLEDTFSGLKKGKSGISKITCFDTEKYDSDSAGQIQDSLIDKDFQKEYKLDKASYLVLTACRDALASASLLEKKTDKLLDCSVFLGTTLGGMLSGQKFYEEYLTNGKENNSFLRDYFACNQAIRVSNTFNLLGQSMILNNACASGLSAIEAGYRQLQQGQNSIALAGGYDVMSAFTHAGFSSLGLVTKDKCQPFDKNRSGLILGEGAGILILEELEHALNRGVNIFSEIIGFGHSADSYHLTRPCPNGSGAYNAINMAINEAKIKPNEIDYINAHGTGTRANDPMESKAIIRALGKYAKEVLVSSTKPMIGHLLGAAGAIELIISILSIYKNFVPINCNYDTPDPECDLNIVTKKCDNINIKIALTNSFGFGGANRSALLSKIL